MIEFGKSLRSAREAKGYTVSQIAEMTHLKVLTVEGLENEDFSMIAAPIYGRGFVKLYCEAVGLDPKPLVEEFMAIVNGDREITIRERPAAEAAEPQAAIPPPPPPPPTPVPERDLFSQEEPVAPVAPVPPPPPPRMEPPSEPTQTQARTQTLSRYAAPVREEPKPTLGGYRSFNPRILVLAGIALALLLGLVFLIRGLYRATSSDAGVPAESAAIAETPSATPEKAPVKATPEANAGQAPRTPQKIPSLYID